MKNLPPADIHPSTGPIAWVNATTATVVIFLIALALLLPPIVHGDVAYYLAMTLGLLRNASPALDPSTFASVTDMIGVAPEVLSATARDGTIYPIHFFFYPLIVVPFYATLEALGTDPFRAFQLTNAAVLALTLWLVSKTPTLAVIAKVFIGFSVLASTGLIYLQWPHPEVLSTCLILGSVMFFLIGRFPLSAALCGLASLQNPSLALFLPMIAFEQLRTMAWSPRAPLRAQIDALKALMPTVACGSVAIVPYLWNLWIFDSLSPIAASFVDVSLIGWDRLSSIFLDLNQGMVIGLPLLIIAFPSCVLIRAMSMIRGRLVVFQREDWLLLAAIVVLLPALGQMNWNSGHSVFARYATWASIFPIVWCAMTLARVEFRAGARVLAPAFALQLLLTAFVAGPAVARHPSSVDFMPWVQPLWETFPHAYNPIPEIFAERVMRAEVPASLPIALTDERGVTLRILRREGDTWAKTSGAVCGSGGHLVPLDARWSSQPRSHSAEGSLEYITGRMLCSHSLPVSLNAGIGRAPGLQLTQGWSKPEQGGTWTSDNQATAALSLHSTRADRPIRLTVEGAAFVASDLHQQRIELYINGERAGEWLANSNQEFEQSFVIAADPGQTALDLRFVLPDAVSPAQLGVSADTRRLALWLTDVRAEESTGHVAETSR